jgi:hypothetical protein
MLVRGASQRPLKRLTTATFLRFATDNVARVNGQRAPVTRRFGVVQRRRSFVPPGTLRTVSRTILVPRDERRNAAATPPVIRGRAPPEVIGGADAPVAGVIVPVAGVIVPVAGVIVPVSSVIVSVIVGDHLPVRSRNWAYTVRVPFAADPP